MVCDAVVVQKVGVAATFHAFHIPPTTDVCV